MLSGSVILYAVLGGILPSFIWLHFLLKEDDRCPEPRLLIFFAFLAGAAAVLLALPLERFAVALLDSGLPVIVAWATIEETLKYLLAALLVLWRRSVNESVDLVIYMLTVALGFAALENALSPERYPHRTVRRAGGGGGGGGHIVQGILTDNLRFVGSTLLHVIASSAIGFALAFSYRMDRGRRALFASGGLILAIVLHTVFNFLIIENDGSHTIFAFFVVWTGAIIFFALFEILKYFRYRRLPQNVC